MTHRRFILCLVVISSTLPSGCVRRRLTVRSDPPGARVYIDDQEIGTTPVSTSFIYYGTREIRLVQDGYETLTVLERFRPPWYQYPPIDYVAENIVPWEIRDERILDFELVPARLVPNHELLERAENVRMGARQDILTPLPDTSQRGVGLPPNSVYGPADTYWPSPRVPVPPPPSRNSAPLGFAR
jgi:hypothetical protein